MSNPVDRWLMGASSGSTLIRKLLGNSAEEYALELLYLSAIWFTDMTSISTEEALSGRTSLILNK